MLLELLIMKRLTEDEIRDAYRNGELTWGDLLEITGLHSSTLFNILYDLINPKRSNFDKEKTK
jgi:hypothetical protein